MLDTTEAVVMLLDREGRIVRFNRACERLTGYVIDEVTGRYAQDLFVIREEALVFQQALTKLRSGSLSSQHQGHWVTKDGARRLIAWSTTGLVDPDGEVRHVVATGLDITDCARSEETLHLSEQKYRQLAESSHEGVWVLDTEGRTTFVNARLVEMLGYAVKEVEGRHIFSFMDEQGVEICRADLEHCREGMSDQHDFEFVRRDGSRMPAILRTSPLRDEMGNYAGTLVLVTDITERKRREALIREQDRFIASILDALSHPFYVVNVEDRTIAMANRAARSSGVAGAVTCYALSHGLAAPCDTTGCVCPLELVKQSGQPAVVEHRHFDGEGRPRTVEVHGYPILDDNGQVTQVIEYALDITERRLTQEALVASEARHRALIETMSEGLAVLDQDQTISYVNDALYRMSGYSNAELLGRSVLDLLPHDLGQPHSDQFHRWRHGEPGTYETTLLRKDGQPLPVILARSSLGDPLGRAGGSVIVVTDITRIRATEQDLRDRTRELAILLDIARQTALSPELHPVLELILFRLSEVVDFDVASVTEWRGEALTELAYVDRVGVHEVELKRLEWLVGSDIGHRLMVDRQPVVIPDVWSGGSPAADLRRAVGDHFNNAYASVHAWLALPLVLEHRTIGILALWHHRADHFSSRMVELASAFASQAALAIERVRLYEQARELAATEERQRLARELHDAVSQTLFSANLSAEVLPRLWERHPEAGRECLHQIHYLTEAALADMRSLLLELRPTGLADTALDELLRQLAAAVTRRTKIPVDVDIGPYRPPPADVHVALYRIAQEALNNVAKYSEASQALVKLRSVPPPGGDTSTTRAAYLELCVRDDGRGFELHQTPGRSMGLKIMQERALMVGAEVQIESRIGSGTTVTVTWPEQPADTEGGT
jgi:two-component system nitrate/nitrite sensor histidine kinase NarX